MPNKNLIQRNVNHSLANIDNEIDVLTGYHAVPSEDSAADAQMRDVVGNKTDTVAGDSAISIAKQIKALVDPKVMGRKQVLEVSVTSAANAGDVTIATVTDQPCIIESIIVSADTASQTDLTDFGVYGGASKVVTFINTTDGAKANIDAVDEQVAWTSDNGAVRLSATKTIVMTLTGSGPTPVDLTVAIVFYACSDGGYLV